MANELTLSVNGANQVVSAAPRPVRTVKQPSKNTDSAFFIQVAAAASLPSQLVYTAAITRLLCRRW